MNIAVVGVGAMGAFHTRICAQLQKANLVGICDVDKKAAEPLIERYGVRFFDDPADMVGKVDAAIIAAPTSKHHAIATQLLSSGIHLLVEKPLAATENEAKELIGLAGEMGLVLQVGHVERFNPAVQELPNVVQNPLLIQAERLSPQSDRCRDVGVVMDLMIHDLDIVAWLAGSEVRDINAVVSRVRPEVEDVAVVSMVFESGLTANLVASRMTQSKVRRLAVTQEDAYIVVDFQKQDLMINRHTFSQYSADEDTRYVQESLIEIPYLRTRGEPLFLEVEHFVDCVLTGARPLVSGEDGLRALALVNQVLDTAGSYNPEAKQTKGD